MRTKIRYASFDEAVYLECTCLDINDITRVVYDKEWQHFFFEFKISRFPGANINTDISVSCFFARQIGMMRHRFRKTWNYLLNIWWAIKGRPYYYVGDPELNHEEAIKLVNFIENCTKDIDPK